MFYVCSCDFLFLPLCLLLWTFFPLSALSASTLFNSIFRSYHSLFFPLSALSFPTLYSYSYSALTILYSYQSLFLPSSALSVSATLTLLLLLSIRTSLYTYRLLHSLFLPLFLCSSHFLFLLSCALTLRSTALFSYSYSTLTTFWSCYSVHLASTLFSSSPILRPYHSLYILLFRSAIITTATASFSSHLPWSVCFLCVFFT